jgi:uncharacterized Fe-S center protein
VTPLCDCSGFTTMPMLPDAGIFGPDDIGAVDQAMLDASDLGPFFLGGRHPAGATEARFSALPLVSAGRAGRWRP